MLPIGGTGNAEERPIPRLRLTKSAIDGLPVQAKDTLYWDAGLPGFGVKVTPQGRKVFLVMYTSRAQARGFARAHHLADGTGAPAVHRTSRQTTAHSVG